MQGPGESSDAIIANPIVIEDELEQGRLVAREYEQLCNLPASHVTEPIVSQV